MNGTFSFDTRITLQTLTKTYSGVGPVDVWTNGEVVWASILQKVMNMFIAIKIEYDERFGKCPIYRVIVRGKKGFDYANTRILWNSPSDGVRTLEPYEVKRLPGTRHTSFTQILVLDITDLPKKRS